MRLALPWLLSLVLPLQLTAEDAPKVLKAGAYAMDITPEKFPVESAGNMGPTVATQVHSPLHARCLVLDNGETKLAIAVCDHCMIPRDIFDAAKAIVTEKTGIPSSQILCSATHTHTGVAVTPTFQSTVELEYCEFLKKKIAEGIIQAHEQREPAQIGWAVGNNARQVFNRRWHMREGFDMSDPFDRTTDKVRMNPPAASSKLLKPAGPIDPQIPVLSVQALDGRPIAVLANYSLHYVGGVPGGSVSADYFGEFADRLGGMLQANSVKPAFVGIMSNGTSADINNVNFFAGAERQPPGEQIKIVAQDVAESAFIAYKRIEYLPWVPLKIAETEVELGVRRPDAEELARAKQILAEAGNAPYSDRRAIYALESVQLSEYPATVKAKLQAVRIGDLGIVTTPCETFVETGLALKQESPLPLTFTIELANGYNGYLPTPEQHALGGYETWRAKSSYLATDAEPLIRRTLLELLHQVVKD